MSQYGSEQKGPVLLTGGSGFVGRYVARALSGLGYSVRILLRSTRRPTEADPLVETVEGDVLLAETLPRAIDGCTAVVHLVGIIREERRKGITFERVHVDGTRNVVDAARAGNVEAFVHMSANGASETGATEYQTSKWKAEELVRAAGFKRWTIFRPSILFGRPGPGCPEFATQLVDTLLKPFPIWPIFGDGAYRLQPLSVEDVARAFARAVEDSGYNGKTYCAAGPESFTYLEIIDILRKAAGLRSRPRIHQPLWLVRPLVDLLAPTGLLPITPGQLEMLIGGNTCDAGDFLEEFSLDPIRFTPEALPYLKPASR